MNWIYTINWIYSIHSTNWINSMNWPPPPPHQDVPPELPPPSLLLWNKNNKKTPENFTSSPIIRDRRPHRSPISPLPTLPPSVRARPPYKKYQGGLKDTPTIPHPFYSSTSLNLNLVDLYLGTQEPYLWIQTCGIDPSATDPTCTPRPLPHTKSVELTPRLQKPIPIDSTTQKNWTR